MRDIREAVKAAYSAAAENPSGAHPFPTGRQFAESIGYKIETLNGIPDECVAAFASVSNISMAAPIPSGCVVLDLGCGSGVDSLIAARRAGPSGRVIGIGFSAAMLARARDGLAKTGIGNVTFQQADAESLPLADASVDIALAERDLQSESCARSHLSRNSPVSFAPPDRCTPLNSFSPDQRREPPTLLPIGSLESPAPGNEMPSSMNSERRDFRMLNY